MRFTEKQKKTIERYETMTGANVIITNTGAIISTIEEDTLYTDDTQLMNDIEATIEELEKEQEPMTIQEMREYLGITRAEFSRRYHIPERTLDDWEKGRRNPAPYILELLQYRITH